MKKMRFFLCVVLSAAALWSCGGDGDGEPGPEPPVPPVVDPNAVEVVNSGFEKGLEGWTRVDFHNGGKVTVEVVEGAGVNDSRCIKIQQSKIRVSPRIFVLLQLEIAKIKLYAY